MKADVILGLQWGDEGKGKIVDLFTPDYDIISRFQGGPNAGHTIHFDQKKFVLHTIPSGIFHPSVENVIGNGVIIDPYILMKEVSALEGSGVQPLNNLLISRRAHLILPTHRMLDAAYEKRKGDAKIGSTLKGIGPSYTDKSGRNGLRFGDIAMADFPSKYKTLKKIHLDILKNEKVDLSEIKYDGLEFAEYEKRWLDSLHQVKKFRIIDSEQYINKCLDQGKSVLAEGAQGSMLDIDFGSYPFVTSSSTIAAGVCSGLGISPHRVGRIFGVFKAYCTRVGSGPFPTELSDETGDQLRKEGNEFGATTGRPRRCGWLDLPALKYAIGLNGVQHLIMMKADVLDKFESIKVCKRYKREGKILEEFPFDLADPKIEPDYEELTGWKESLSGLESFEKIPVRLAEYTAYIERETGVPVTMISVGPDRKQTLKRI